MSNVVNTHVLQMVRVAFVTHRHLTFDAVGKAAGVGCFNAEVEHLVARGEILGCEDERGVYAWCGSRSHLRLLSELSELLYQNAAGLVHSSIFGRSSMAPYTKDEITLAVMDLVAQKQIETVPLSGGRIVHRWIANAPDFKLPIEADESFTFVSNAELFAPRRPRPAAVVDGSCVGAASRPSARTLAGKSLVLIEAKPGITRLEIAEITGASAQVISTNLDTLRRNGFIRKSFEPGENGWFPMCGPNKAANISTFNQLAQRISMFKKVREMRATAVTSQSQAAAA